MDLTVLLLLSSGLFLGWALGANDAANVFGTAVGAGMVRFYTAAIICSIFLILGAVISGGGTTSTLSKLGAINALPGAFIAALAAALSVYLMTKFGLPVSTSQAIVGAIVGWNIFSGTPTEMDILTQIVLTWLLCPVLAAIFSVIIYGITIWLIRNCNIHLLRMDAYTRLGLIIAGIVGSYSLGANNIANVVGVFMAANPFTDFNFTKLLVFSATDQMFLVGAIAIAVGVFTYSKRVMVTVGAELMPLSPIGAWVAVVAHSIVLFVFASQGLEALLKTSGLPTIPLVPVSSSQAVVGAVVGIAFIKGRSGIQWNIVAKIGLGWVFTPILALGACIIGLYFAQNVFDQTVFN